MLTSTTFQRDFTRAKETVLELKNALKDFLDQESQDNQEKCLENIESAQVESNEKLASMDDQLGQIKAMLQAQVDEKAKEANASLQVEAEEEQIYENLKKAADVTGDVPFKRFVIAFEIFFYGGEDMPPEQRRGLKICIDKDGSNEVSKPEWIKFYRKWTAANINMEEFLNGVAAENPSVYTRGARIGSAVKDKAATKMEAAKVRRARSKAISWQRIRKRRKPHALVLPHNPPPPPNHHNNPHSSS